MQTRWLILSPCLALLAGALAPGSEREGALVPALEGEEAPEGAARDAERRKAREESLERERRRKQEEQEKLEARKVELVAKLRGMRGLAPAHRSIIATQKELAQTLRMLGKLDAAEKIVRHLEGLVASMARPDASLLLGIQSEIALILGDREDFAGARDMLLKILSSHHGKEGDSHRLWIQEHLGIVQHRLKAYEEAAAVWRDILKVRLKTQSQGAREVLYARGGLAAAWVELKRCEKALPILEANVAALRSLPDERLTLEANLFNLAGGLSCLGRNSEALACLEEVRALEEERLADDDLHLVRTRVRIAEVSIALKRFKEARLLLEGAIEVYSRDPAAHEKRLEDAREMLASLQEG